MGKFGFMLKALSEGTPKRFGKYIRTASELSGKSRFRAAMDMIVTVVVSGAGPADYLLFEMWNKTIPQRRTFITRSTNNALVKKYNTPEGRALFEDKYLFAQRFSELYGRICLKTDIMTKKEFEDLCATTSKIIYKPLCGTCGKGIEIYDLNHEDVSSLWEKLHSGEVGICEEVVEQCDELSAIYPGSVNTVRFTTIFHDGKCTPIYAFLRIGNGGRFVDNLNSGGMAGKIDLETGEITLPAADKDGKVYSEHPLTGTPIVGFFIPRWDEVKAFAARAAAICPETGYAGWDICIRKNDMVLIEGNGYPGHDILQLPAYTPDGWGMKPLVKDFL